MKYLNNREEFLKRSINKIEEYKSIDKLTEGVDNSGPFANDIPWGNSLLGRLINATIRRARIGANLVRIKGVCRRLKDSFEELLGNSVAGELSDEEKKELIRLKIFNFLNALDEAIERGDRVGDIKNLTKQAINDIKAFEDFENKDSLISQLEDFLKFLEQFKDDEGGDSIADEDKEEGEGEDKEGEGEGKEGEGKEGSGEKSASSLYPVMVKNLKALGLILDAYKRVKLQPTTSQAGKVGPKYKTKDGDTVDKIVANTAVNVKKLTADLLRQKNKKILDLYPKNNQTLKPGLELVMEATIGAGGSPDRGNVKSGEDHLTQAFTKIKRDIEVLISAKEKGIGVDTNFINAISSKAVDSNTKELIKSLYIEINRYLVGDKKATLQDKDPLFKESVEVISDKNKKIIVAEKIARFTKRALQFDKQGLYGGLGDLGRPLQDFVETMKQIMQMQPSAPKKEEPKKEEPKKEEPKKEEAKKEEAKKESFLFRYDSFIKVIKEADEAQKEGDKKESDDKDSSVGDPEVQTTSQKIKDYWKKKVNFKEFAMEKTEVEKTKANFDKLEKKKRNSITIQGLDPVLDIVKCFNRAYKIHTTKTIPNVGTSDGRVSPGVFGQYTCFGTGTRANAGLEGGPYRNNAIFNQWESTVLDIMKERKYQVIFTPETKLRVGDTMIEKAGSNLRKFMNDMIDGDTLYKTDAGKDGQGKQAEFLDKYFGYKEGDANKLAEATTFDGPEESEAIGKVANQIKTIDLEFTKDPIKYESADELKKTFFAAYTKEGKMYYFYIQDIVGDMAYLVYSRSFWIFNQYIDKSGMGTGKKLQGDLPKAINKDLKDDNGNEYNIKATKKKLEEIIGKDGIFKLNGNRYEVNFISKYKGKTNDVNAKPKLADKPDEIKIVGCYSLYQQTKDVETKTGKQRFKLDKDISNLYSTIGGFKNISQANGINQTKMFK